MGHRFVRRNIEEKNKLFNSFIVFLVKQRRNQHRRDYSDANADNKVKLRIYSKSEFSSMMMF